MLLSKTAVINWPVEIVPIQMGSKLIHFLPCCIADGWIVHLHHTVEIVPAVVVMEGVVQFLWDNVEVVDSLWECRWHIILPISGPVSNNEPLEIDGFNI